MSNEGLHGRASFSLARVQRAGLQFVLGKGITAPLTLLNVILIVRLCPAADYGIYVTAFALSEIALALSDLGLSWAAWRFIPTYRLGAGARLLRIFISQIIGARAITLCVGAGVMFLAAEPLAALLGIRDAALAMRLAAALVIVDGLGRFIREIILESLILQGRIQIAQFVRTVSLTVALAYCLTQGVTDLSFSQALVFELASAACAVLASVGLLVHYLAQDRDPRDPAWMAPSRARIVRLMWQNYVSVAVTYLTGPQAMTAVASRFTGPEGAAVFGMVRNFVEQIRRYLPSELFAGLVRPAIIASYELNQDFSRLRQYAQAIYKTSYATLLPVVAVAAALGGDWLTYATAGRYPDSHWTFLVLLSSLIPAVHRRVLEMVVNIVDSADLWLKGAIIGGVCLPMAVAMTYAGWGVESMACAMLFGELVTNAVIIRGLATRGYKYHIDGHQIMLTFGLTLCVCLSANFALQGQSMSISALVGISALAVALTVGIVAVCRLFNREETAMFRAALSRRREVSAH